MFTVIETASFEKKARRLLTEDEYARLVLTLAENPESGSLIKGTGRARKLRFAIRAKGKSGGVRIIHFCLSSAGKVYLLDIYAKNDKSTLTKAEEKELAMLIELIEQEHKK